MDNSLVVTNDQLLSNLELFDKINEYKNKVLVNGQDYYFRDGVLCYMRSGWNKIALFFNITCEIIKEYKETRIDELKKKQVYIFDFTARATLPNGRYNEDVGSCSSDEPNKTFQRLRHDTRCNAMTRAKGRAISGIIGGGIVHEELPDQPKKNNTKKQIKSKFR